MKRAASPETGTTRKTLPGYSELSSLAKGTSVYEEKETNYITEENKILQNQKEINELFESLNRRDKKDETKA